MNESSSLGPNPYRNVENQLCLTVRAIETSMTQPGFHRRKQALFSHAQNTYWGALLTLFALPEPGEREFRPVHIELKRLRSTLTAFRY